MAEPDQAPPDRSLGRMVLLAYLVLVSLYMGSLIFMAIKGKITADEYFIQAGLILAGVGTLLANVTQQKAATTQTDEATVNAEQVNVVSNGPAYTDEQIAATPARELVRWLQSHPDQWGRVWEIERRRRPREQRQTVLTAVRKARSVSPPVTNHPG